MRSWPVHFRNHRPSSARTRYASPISANWTRRGTYLAAQYRRLTARRGKKKAAVALGHAILIIVYHLLSHDNEVYQDLGVHHFDERRRERVERGLVQRLKDLGYKVTLEPAQPDTSAA
jgi:hypothetical protein